MGPPGVGKGTISQIMSADYPKVKHVSLGSYFRYYSTLNNSLGKKIKNLIDQGLLVTNDVISSLIKKIFDTFSDEADKDILVLDGFPRNKEQVDLFFSLYNSEYVGKILYTFFFITLNAKYLKGRLLNRIVCSGCDKIYSALHSQNTSDCGDCQSPLVKRKDDSVDIIEKRISIYFQEEKEILSYLKDRNIDYCEYDSEKISAEAIVSDMIKKYS
jgi:adenylate kinase